jgi:hypothetical protein
MARGPAFWIGIDGIDGVGKTTAAHSVSAILDIPIVRSGYNPESKPWPNSLRRVNDLMVMSTIHQLQSYLPSIVFDRTMISVCAYNREIDPREFPWETYYPQNKTIFITLTDDIERTIKSEGLEVFRPLMLKRIHEQKRFLDMSRFMGQRGYKTRIISSNGGPDLTHHAIIKYIRGIQLETLETLRRERIMEDD